MISELFAFPLRALIVAAVLPIQCAKGASLPDPSIAFEAAGSVHEALATSADKQAWPIVRRSTNDGYFHAHGRFTRSL
jgi:hypothetical protein